MSRPGPTAVGLFVLGALTLIVAGVLFFGGGALFSTRLKAVSFFHGSVAGLQVGAAVTYRGVEVGQVKAIGIRIEPKTFDSIVQVDMELLPDSVKIYGGELEADATLIPKLVERGLTAQLVKQSFVTGLLTVDLDFRPDADAKRRGEPISAMEIPTVPTDLERLARKARDFDLPAAVETLQSTLQSLDRLLKAPDLQRTIGELPELTIQLRQTLKTVDGEVAGLSASVREVLTGSTGSLTQTLASVQRLVGTLEREATTTAAAARGTLQKADSTLAGVGNALGGVPATLEATNRTLEGVNRTLDPNGRTMIQIQRAVDDLAATAARLRNLAERVDRDPSILIRGR
jgi:paraquat-inducible protein B